MIKQTLPNFKPLITTIKTLPRKTKMVETTGRITKIIVMKCCALNDMQHFNPQHTCFVYVGILKDTSERVQTESAVESVRNDVDQDVFLMFNVVDENLSWYLLDNIQKCSDPAGVDRKDPDFHESNLMHGERLVVFKSFSD